MSLPRKAVLGILADNLRKRGSVLPLSRRTRTRWADGLDLPHGGKTVLYTGHMYQLIPTINAMAKKMRALEGSWVTRFMGLGRVVNKAFSVSRFMGRVDTAERTAFDRALRNIALLLQEAGVEFGYLYEKELYSGALLHDEGLDVVLARHALRVKEVLLANGVQRVITVDPHTTHMLRTVYPDMLDGFPIEVRSYLEVLAEANLQPRQPAACSVSVHDSCLYARYEDVLDEPRTLLRRAGARVSEPELSGLSTHCCGGPVESLFPARAHDIASERVKQLEATGADMVAAMCPICLVNLQGAANGTKDRFRDISTVLADAFLPGASEATPSQRDQTSTP